ncbi:unnamed protein product, partial [marine sediment metagenome]
MWRTVFGKFSLYRYRSKREVDSQALSYGLHGPVSDIPANKEVELPAERYFRCGDVDDLKEKMDVLLEKELSEEEREEICRQIEEKYNPKLSSKRHTSRGKL